MALTPSHRVLLLATLGSVGVACSSQPNVPRDDEPTAQSAGALGVIRRPPPPTPQSFLPPVSWSNAFTSSSGWNPYAHVRLVVDRNADGRADIVAFGDAGVWVADSLGAAFEPPRFVVAAFGTNGGWTVDKHVRTVGDLDGDGHPDIVAFGDAGVWTAHAEGSGFGPPAYALADFGYDQGWRVDRHVRMLADVNGDGRDDIVAFGDAGVYVSISTASGVGPSAFVLAQFGADQGWDPALHVRTMADIDGDGRADIVAFGYDGVWTALSTGTSFAAPHYVLAAYGSGPTGGGWVAGGRHERRLVDLDGDHKADIVGFGESGTYVSRATGDGGFTAATLAVADFGFQQMGYALPGESARFVGDFNGDGHPDIVGYFDGQWVRRSIGLAGGGFQASANVLNVLTNIGGVIDAADVDHDGMLDLVGFAATDVVVERSTASPVPPPPAAPSNAHVAGATPTSLTLAWNDNSTDEVAFGISYKNQVTGVQGYASAPANVAMKTITGLTSNGTYCYTVSAWGYFGTTSAPQACGATLPAGPTITLTASTHTSLGFALSAPGASALRWDLDGVSTVTTQPGASASPVFTGLTAGTSYCLRAAAQIGATWSPDSVACFATPAVETGVERFAMNENPPPYTGYVSYSGRWVPGGRTITSLGSAYGVGQGIAFLKPGHDPVVDCGNVDALVFLAGPGATLSPSDVAKISWTQPDGSIVFVGCPAGMPVIAPFLVTNIYWSE